MVTNKILCSMNNRLNRAEVFQGGDFTTSYMELGSIQYTQTQTGTSRYRYVGDDPKTVTLGDLTQESTRYTGSRATLYANGQAVATNRSASLYDNGRAYFGTDILGSVRSATDDYATLEDRYEYDIFGTPYEGDFTSGLNNGYTGKPYDTITGLYNYGYRDYSPQQARFTTVDPIRDGNNWFSYVVNDPVNYVDLWGLYIAPTEGNHKQQHYGFLRYLGNSELLAYYYGCLTVSVADIIATLNNDDSITPVVINSNNSNFTDDKSGNMDVKATVESYGLEHDYWTQKVQGNLANKINELHNSDETYGVSARVAWNDDGDQHWVTLQGGTFVNEKTGIEYVKAKGTSENDYVKDSRPDSWIMNADNTISIPVTEVEKIHTVKKITQQSSKND